MWRNLCVVWEGPFDGVAPIGMEFTPWVDADSLSGLFEILVLIDVSLLFDGCIDNVVVTGLRGSILAELSHMRVRTLFSIALGLLFVQTGEMLVDMKTWTTQPIYGIVDPLYLMYSSFTPLCAMCLSELSATFIIICVTLLP